MPMNNIPQLDCSAFILLLLKLNRFINEIKFKIRIHLIYFIKRSLASLRRH
jgi:hypothetical protein